MNYKEAYNYWLGHISKEDAKELKAVTDEKEIEERFYRELEFGTAGMRGILGIGTNRINVYNVRRASQGVAECVLSKGSTGANAGVLIGYDTRHYSRRFAEETAAVLCGNGIKVYLFDKVHSVPEVSFGIRELKAEAGVMITASHNPKEYNGYKVYGSDGGQIPPAAAEVVISAIEKCDYFSGIKYMQLDEAREKGLLITVGDKLDNRFLEEIQKQQQNPEAVREIGDTLKLVYTPFHGTGSRPVQAILKKIGFKNVLVVKEQDTEDGDFPTVKSPNPEDKEGFTLAIDIAKKNDVDIIIGTDPDCDRVGIVVRDSDGVYRTLTGNQTGALLTEYILESKKEKNTLPENGVVIKTIVTTELVAAIAKAYGVEIMNVLTGFKYIGEKMTEFESTGSHKYLFGFEESYGYLAGTHARDKDGVVSTMLIAEMTAYYKLKGMSPYDALMNIYKKYGYYFEKTVSIVMPGKDGMEKMLALLTGLRNNPLKKVCGMDVTAVNDYQLQIRTENGKTTPMKELPKSNVLKYYLSDGKTYFVVRPSGTEPKVKLYFGTSSESMETSEKIIENLLKDIKAQLGV